MTLADIDVQPVDVGTWIGVYAAVMIAVYVTLQIIRVARGMNNPKPDEAYVTQQTLADMESDLNTKIDAHERASKDRDERMEKTITDLRIQMAGQPLELKRMIDQAIEPVAKQGHATALTVAAIAAKLGVTHAECQG